MSQDQPPGAQPDSDRTILVPTPGRRRAAASPAPGGPAAGQPAVAATPRGQSAALPCTSGVNPLVAAANPLLDLVVPLRVMASHADVEGLRQQLVGAIKKFEADARAAMIDFEAVAAARYALCTLLDETISSTPWGAGGVWASRSLLVAFHNEAFGGEKFFVILQRLCQDPRANLHVLELFYVCLALGLEGRYRVLDGGRGQLDVLRERLQQLIAKERGAFEAELSPHWKGAGRTGSSLRKFVPLWIIAGVAALVLLALHLAFSFSLNRKSDPVYAALQRIAVAAPLATTRPKPEVPAQPRLSKWLQQDIERALVGVTETADRSTVTLHGDGVFASGRAEVIDAFEPLLGRIGEALRTVPGKVLVIGHTDDVPSASAQFPSNWALSKARAAAVVDLLARRAGPASRYAIEGRGETEPLVPNTSAANRARNRRVVIILLTQ
ncbi:type IVB secretion system protein IcmH/DotU [Massilia horti]|uniref:Type VI secretion system protein TssL n=1 Tax=Massilia horti TaxID=2562153 RepID=A0A4Y9SZV9_9BURK|nr:type IVB secretion system protein IcmH/DotU [Massilia horti]TFW31985.1 type VI secretion system protein TssL [Massilia horti]